MAKPSASHIDRRLLKPTMRVSSVLDIDIEALRARGVRGIIFDLDDTLVCSLSPTAEENVCAFLEAIRDEFRVYIVSNNLSHDRVTVAADHLNLPYLSKARKPSRRFFRKALDAMQLEAREVAIVGDQLFTDVLGGNRLGAVTILVDPLSAEHKWHRKVMRSVETYMLKGKRGAYHTPVSHHASMNPPVSHHH